MAPKRTRLILALTCWLGGIWLGSGWLSQDASPLLVGAAISLGLSLVLRSYWFGVVSLGLCFGLLGVWQGTESLRSVTLTEPIIYNGEVELVSIKFTHPPQQRVVLKLQEGEKQGYRIRGMVYDWQADPGTHLTITTKIIPSQFTSDRGSNIIGQSQGITVNQTVSVPNNLHRFRARLQTSMQRVLPEPYASLALGLLTGVNDDFDTHFRDDLKRTGTSHIVAVSGYNLTIVALVLQRLGQQYSRRFGTTLALGAIGFYLLLAGLTPSMLRGAIVAVLTLLALTFGRPTHRLPLVLLAGSLLAWLMPLGLRYNLSWQLSFLAFSGIIFLSPLIVPWWQSRFRIIGATIAETLSAELFVLPLLIAQFGTISIIGPLVNAIILPLVPFAMAASALQAAVAIISVRLGQIMAWVSYPLLWLIIEPIHWASRFPLATVTIPADGWEFWLISCGIIAAGLVLYGYKRKQLI